MSKFCQNCGNMLDDSAAFCDNCGKPFEAPDVQPAAPAAPQYEAPAAPQYQAPAAPQYQAPAAPQYGAGAPVAVAEKKSILQFVKDKKFFFIGGAAVIVLVIVLIIVLGSCGANSAEGALQKAFDCGKNVDLRGAADVNYELNFSNNTNKEEELKKQEEQLKAYSSMIEMAKSMMKDAKLKITKSEPVSEDEQKSMKESWSSSYKDTDKITEIVKLSYEVSGIMGSTQNGECYAVKVNGKWYVKDYSGSGSLGM